MIPERKQMHMTIYEEFEKIGEYTAMGAFEEESRSLFYRKALGLRRYYENCKLYPYTGKPLYPSEKKQEQMLISPFYLHGLGIDWERVTDENRALIQTYANDFFRYTSKVPAEHTVAGNMWCHSFPNYGRILREGLNSYAKRAEQITDTDLREGLLHLCNGLKCYIQRCVCYLEEVHANADLIRALKKVPLEKADTIYEAIVAWNFVMYLDSCDNLGCLAKELIDFYHGEDISSLLDNLYDNLDANDGYSMALHADYNELTVPCLKAAKGKRRPMIELFVDENTPPEIWDAAFELMRSGGGQPAFYNSNLLLNGIQKALHVSDADIKNFCGGGCTESMIAGMSLVGSLDAGINCLLILEQTIYDELPQATCFEDFYATYIERVRVVAEDIMQKISLSQQERAEFNPLPMRTLLIDDCIEKGVEYNSGGARYTASLINFAGLINVIDALLAIREILFEKKSETVEDFLNGLKRNDEILLHRCRNVKKSFGRDDDESNAFAKQLSHTLFSMLDTQTPYLGGKFLPAAIQFRSQVEAGRQIGATPDGRKAGMPLCDSLAAIFGKDTKGPTALLKSVTSLDLSSALGVPVLSFNIDGTWNNEVLKALILSYLQMGGIQMQLTCVSGESLLEAYRNPELHKNIVVRVGGYSEYFYRLTDELKK